MVTSLGQIVVLGLPVTIVFGILAFISLLATAILGILVLKGLYNIPFRWHMGMAAAAILFAVIHVVLILQQYFF